MKGALIELYSRVIGEGNELRLIERTLVLLARQDRGIGLAKLREVLAENDPDMFQPQPVNAVICVRMGRWHQFDQAGEAIWSKV